MKELSNGKESCVRADKFREEVVKLNKQFSGKQQHDSHEFMIFILTALHQNLKEPIPIKQRKDFVTNIDVAYMLIL